VAVRRLPLTWSSPPESIVIKIPATQKRTTASWVGFVTASRNVLQAPLPVSAAFVCFLKYRRGYRAPPARLPSSVSSPMGRRMTTEHACSRPAGACNSMARFMPVDAQINGLPRPVSP
jgi:hypothetical protein